MVQAWQFLTSKVYPQEGLTTDYSKYTSVTEFNNWSYWYISSEEWLSYLNPNKFLINKLYCKRIKL